MPVVNYIIQNAADNAEQRASGGLVYLNVSPRMANCDNIGTWNGFIFRDVNLPAGAIINQAYLTFQMGVGSLDEPDVTIYGLDSETVTTFATNAYNISNRARTTASVDWSNNNVGIGDVNTSDITTIISELLASYGGYTNGDVGFVLTSRVGDASRDTSIKSLASSATACARLYIDYSAGNSQPTIVQDTADAYSFTSNRPILQFTGSDVDSDLLTYEIVVASNPDLRTDGVALADNNFDAGGGGFHLNGTAGVTWEGYNKVDDRFGTCFQGQGGILDTIGIWLRSDSADQSTDGYALVRIYDLEPGTTPGIDGKPKDYAAQGSTPTAGWLAQSELNYYDYDTVNAGDAEKAFNFTGFNRVYLEKDKWYFLIVDWRPSTGAYNNLIECDVISDPDSHPGNVYIDADSANYGVWLNSDLWFKVYEDATRIEAHSDIDAGFSSGVDSDPFPAGQQVNYQILVGSELYNSINWYWTVRVNDPTGNNVWTDWTGVRNFEVDFTDTSYELTADEVTSEPVVVSNPTIGQTFALMGEDISASPATVSDPYLSQSFNLTANLIIGGIPLVSDPDISTIFALTADSVMGGIPLVSDPDISTIFALTADSVIGGIPSVSDPYLLQGYNLTANPIIGGIPLVSDPDISTIFALTANSVIGGIPSVSDPYLLQGYNLTANPIIGGIPLVSDPDISTIFALTADSVIGGIPSVSDPYLLQGYNLTVNPIIGGIPLVSDPDISTIFALTADSVIGGIPSVSDPYLLQGYNLTANPIIGGIPLVSDPDISTIFALTADSVIGGIPSVSDPNLTQSWQLVASPVIAGPVVVSDPLLSTLFSLLADPVIGGIPSISDPIVHLWIAETPDKRTFIILFEDRTIDILYEDTIFDILYEDRSITVD